MATKRIEHDVKRIVIDFSFGSANYSLKINNPGTVRGTLFSIILPISLTAMAEDLGIDSHKERKWLLFHDSQYKRYLYFGVLLFLILYTPVALILIRGLFFMSNWMEEQNFQISDVYSIAIPLLLYFILLSMVVYILYQLIEKIRSRAYAATVAVEACLKLLLLVSNDDIFPDPSRNYIVLKQMRVLRNSLHLVASKYRGKNEPTNIWVDEFFKKADLFLENIEKNIIAPKYSTSEKITTDLVRFSKILISGNYGEFRFRSRAAGAAEQSQTRPHSVWSLLARLIGTLVPIVLLALIYLYPELFAAFGESLNLVAMVVMFWLLLNIDAVLGTGIYDRLSGIVKSVKDLK